MVCIGIFSRTFAMSHVMMPFSFQILLFTFLIFRYDSATTENNVYDGLMGTLVLFLVVSALAFPNGNLSSFISYLSIWTGYMFHQKLPKNRFKKLKIRANTGIAKMTCDREYGSQCVLNISIFEVRSSVPTLYCGELCSVCQSSIWWFFNSLSSKPMRTSRKCSLGWILKDSVTLN